MFTLIAPPTFSSNPTHHCHMAPRKFYKIQCGPQVGKRFPIPMLKHYSTSLFSPPHLISKLYFFRKSNSCRFCREARRPYESSAVSMRSYYCIRLCRLLLFVFQWPMKSFLLLHSPSLALTAWWSEKRLQQLHVQLTPIQPQCICEKGCVHKWGH